MPQMAPIWWSTMFIIFIMTYLTIMVMMYFYNIYILDKNMISKTSCKNMNWKW